MHQLSTLIYCSRVSPDLNVAQLYDIMAYSNHYNSVRHITGILVFNSRHFLQAIEGDHTEILTLRDKIQRNPFHVDFFIIGHEILQFRTWANWTMNLITPNKTNQKIFEQFNNPDGFDPYRLTYAQAHALLLQLVKHILIPADAWAMAHSTPASL